MQQIPRILWHDWIDFSMISTVAFWILSCRASQVHKVVLRFSLSGFTRNIGTHFQTLVMSWAKSYGEFVCSVHIIFMWCASIKEIAHRWLVAKIMHSDSWKWPCLHVTVAFRLLWHVCFCLFLIVYFGLLKNGTKHCNLNEFPTVCVCVCVCVCACVRVRVREHICMLADSHVFFKQYEPYVAWKARCIL
jgi:hypothetical protein